MSDRDAPDSTPTCPVLKPWESGRPVAELQELLSAHGFDLRIDGDFGWITEAAVRFYQRQQGLNVDGIVSVETWKALTTTVQPGARILRFGYWGEDVRQVQGLLHIGGYPLNRDGVLGTRSRTAVITFQQQQQLKATGIVDSITWRVLSGKDCPQPAKQTNWRVDRRHWW